MSVMIQVPSGQRQLFIDDHAIQETVGLQKTLNQPSKYSGNPILRPIHPWECSVNLYGTVMYDDDTDCYRMWYQGYGGAPYTACYATSNDGIFWERPRLGLIEYQGSKDNNLVLDDACVMNVIKEPLESDPNRRYKALFCEELSTANVPGKSFSVSVAFSPDGAHWTKYANNPVLTGTSDTHTLLGWDGLCDKYVAYPRPATRNGTRKRLIGRSVSDDFVNWTEPKTVMSPDELDPPDLEFYGMPVFKYEGLYLGMPWIYHTYAEEPYVRMQATGDVQLASSRDGIVWERTAGRATFIPNGPRGSMDQGIVYGAKEPLIIGDELWFYYGAYDDDHGVPERNGNICLAKLRLDGFVSLDAGEASCYLVTNPFRCNGGELRINAEARGGSIEVALLDEVGFHHSGYEKTKCAMVDGNGIRQRVTWHDYVNLDSLRGKTVRLKFYLRSAKLYSFTVG